jgi:hypothetical protein
MRNGEAERLGGLEITHIASCSNNALASLRSSVSNPSVNHP